VTAGTPRRCPESARNISDFPDALEDRATCRRIGPSDLASALATLAVWCSCIESFTPAWLGPQFLEPLP
jgi:hypothetical protein